MEHRLRDLGLNSSQIHNVMTRLPSDMIPVFIEKWNKEKNITKMSNIDAGSPLNRVDTTKSVQYLPRMIPNVTTRISSKEMNSIYQEKTQSRMNPCANLDIMAVQLFGSPENGYTEEYLNKTYKKLALSFHPDKQGGDATKFNMLTTTYKHLKIKLEPKYQIPDKERKHISVPPPDSLFDSKFDPSVFNNYYEKNAFQEKEHGYGNWLKESSSISVPERPSETNFNSAYEDHKKKVYSRNKGLQVTKYGPPEDTSIPLNFQLLGADVKLDDYSGQTDSNGICYTDLRKAHENTHLIYEDNFKQNDVASDVQKEFMRARQNLKSKPGRMTQSELESVNEFKQREKEREENRLFRLRQQDEDLGEHFKNIHHSRLTT